MENQSINHIVLTDHEFELLRTSFLLIISDHKKYLKKLYLNPEVNKTRISFFESELNELQTLFDQIYLSIYEE